ncbi:MAG: formylglycine-generating enzyme family protein [Pseudomonadota bacterium]
MNKFLSFSTITFFASAISPAHADIDFHRFKDCPTCPEMIVLPTGEFTMGAPEDELRRRAFYSWEEDEIVPVTPENPFVKDDEGPQHKVIISRQFAMSINEVTYGQWWACLADGGCGGYAPSTTTFKDGPVRGKLELTADHPVIYVSYDDVSSYIEWINTKVEGAPYRLPTEAEWEFAARAGTQTRFPQGDDVSSSKANFNGDMTSLFMMEKRADWITRGAVVPVDELDAANNWGLRHMTGNAAEYTSSCYNGGYAGWEDSEQYLSDSLHGNCLRVLRGGSFGFSLDSLRSAWRMPSRDQTAGTKYKGFRIIKEID